MANNQHKPEWIYLEQSNVNADVNMPFIDNGLGQRWGNSQLQN